MFVRFEEIISSFNQLQKKLHSFSHAIWPSLLSIANFGVAVCIKIHIFICFCTFNQTFINDFPIASLIVCTSKFQAQISDPEKFQMIQT